MHEKQNKAHGHTHWNIYIIYEQQIENIETTNIFQ